MPKTMPKTMRRIVANVFVSLDGVAETPEKWAPPLLDDEVKGAIAAQLGGGDAILLGRRTYQTFAEAFTGDKRDDPFGKQMTATPKYVLSSTLTEADWANTTLVGDDPAAAVAALKAAEGGDIVVNGSVSVLRWLLERGLLDEVSVMVFPLVLGSGDRLFPEGTAEIPLALRSSRAFATGVVQLVYSRAEEGA
ncbi:dihydrofolate reductase family protein [Actinocorallia sp. A-T 12471]|uniref:dihydrofolate reductase family protein n=1 Tax=Actinocorallia sp. A-T 12471 TaxID=3089813 RepID=UPI0029CE5780|nr:dihydrofolate reductase family protein [Actinocorallia sp. A-T 12471]MDX6741631.1 dihydrofolate reductase family protein [Actinocorallia sp. A-T 12471]